MNLTIWEFSSFFGFNDYAAVSKAATLRTFEKFLICMSENGQANNIAKGS